MKTKLITTVLCLAFLTAMGQEPMDPGFRMLETGDFQRAEVFFDAYLEKEPKNKTALICYGRAVGLNGKPKNAATLFSSLLEEYPRDLEIRLNLYESYLWGKEYKKAKGYYQSLVTENPDNFSALLGYANTLSNLKQYEDALHYINKALEVKPKNTSARISRKYIKLGRANQLAMEREYQQGISLMNEILADFPGDREVLLNLANLNIQAGKLENARKVYGQMARSAQDSVVALTGISLVEHLNGEDKTALSTAVKAMDMAGPFEGEDEHQQALERYIQALIWNGQFKQARLEIAQVASGQEESDWVLALGATLGMYTGEFDKSLERYSRILDKDNSSFDGNLGKANALFAKGEFDEAYKAAYRTLEIFPKQKDTEAFLEKLNRKFRPVVTQKGGHSFDNGNNSAYFQETAVIIPVSTKLSGSLFHQHRITENTANGDEALSNLFSAGLNYQLMAGLMLKANMGINQSRFADTSYSLPITALKLQLKSLKRQNLELGYRREVQNFNAELISREIVMNHYGLNYNLGTNVNLGWFTQLMHTQQTDGNNRNLVFSSLYYTLLKKPALKLGLNYQYLSFSEQLPEIYFSPESFHAYELFTDTRGNLGGKIQYALGAAGGFQKVEDGDFSPIFRAELNFGHRISKRLDLGLYGKYSNIASAIATGFEFTELGITLQWAVAKVPLFHKKLKR